MRRKHPAGLGQRSSFHRKPACRQIGFAFAYQKIHPPRSAPNCKRGQTPGKGRGFFLTQCPVRQCSPLLWRMDFLLFRRRRNNREGLGSHLRVAGMLLLTYKKNHAIPQEGSCINIRCILFLSRISLRKYLSTSNSPRVTGMLLGV